MSSGVIPSQLEAALILSRLATVEDSEKMFSSIKSSNHAGLEQILAQNGPMVDIIPRIGCAAIHYSKYNLANWETANGESPITMATRVGSRMVEIVLRYGGNPNHCNKKGETPLCIAAVRCDEEAIDALLNAGADLRVAVLKLISELNSTPSAEQQPSNGDLASRIKPLTILLSNDVYLKCRYPIKTAFDVSKIIASIKNVRDEFKLEFELLINNTDLFGFRFVNSCDRMWEARRIITSPVDLVEMGTAQKKKMFISHPFTQQIVKERYNGSFSFTGKTLCGKTALVLQYIFSHILLLPLLLKFCLIDVCCGISLVDSNLGHVLKLMSTPCLSFVTDVVNYISFFFVLVVVCLTGKLDVHEMSIREIILYVFVLVRILVELDLLIQPQHGLKSQFKNMKNYIELTYITLLIISMIIKLRSVMEGEIHDFESYAEQHVQNYVGEEDNTDRIIKDYELDKWSEIIMHHRKILNISYFYAMAEFHLFIRVLCLLESTKSMGPIIIAIRQIASYCAKFFLLATALILVTSVAAYSLDIREKSWNKDIQMCDFLSPTAKKWNEARRWNETADLEKIMKSMTDGRRMNLPDHVCSGNLQGPPGPPGPSNPFGTLKSTFESILGYLFGLTSLEVSTTTAIF